MDASAEVEQVDVVVIGYGDAGATAALTAHDHGAEVVVLERQPAEDHRPNSRYAAGFFIVPGDPVRAARYLHGLYAVNGEDDDLDLALIDTWIQEAGALPEWLDDMGCPHEAWGEPGAEHEGVEGAAGILTRRATYAHGTPGCPVHAFLTDQVAVRNIDVRFGSDVRRLLVDGEGSVIGVEVRTGGATRRIHARSVVLATGGYEANDRLKRQTLPVWPVHFFGTRRNDGAGIHMATAVGADLWHMNAWPGRLVAHVPDSGYRGGVSIRVWGRPDGDGPVPGGVFVDRRAQRFMPEPSRQHAAHHHVMSMDAETLQRAAVPAWWVFDARRLGAGPLPPTHSGPTGPVADFQWSADNAAEVARGWIRQAPTVHDLARTCGLDPDRLQGTVDRYNAACVRGVDEDFGRDPTTLTPLDSPPFHAVQLWPGGSHTVGGPRHDAYGRVLRPDSSVIDGLYACGEVGSMYGLLYPSGGASITECLAFGRVVGRAVAGRAG